MTIETAFMHRCILGEGPVWDPHTHTICWIDILDPCIHTWHEPTATHQRFQLPSMIGCASLDERGDFIVGLEDGFWKGDRHNGHLTPIASVESELSTNRFNDGKCDPSGRFWAGSLSLNETDPTGSVYCMDANRNTRKMIDGVTISNGLCWSLDRKYFYYIDTPTLAVARYDYDDQTGNISNKTIIIRIPSTHGFPDGMTIDAAGMLWVAHWGGWQITRWDPGSGKQLDAIRLHASQITSLCFGGDQFNEIYVTSASRGLTEEQWLTEPLAGQLFVIRHSGYKGLPFFTYPSNEHD